jgi:hypothetical protein
MPPPPQLYENNACTTVQENIRMYQIIKERKKYNYNMRKKVGYHVVLKKKKILRKHKNK